MVCYFWLVEIVVQAWNLWPTCFPAVVLIHSQVYLLIFAWYSVVTQYWVWHLSKGFSARQAQREVVKIKNLDSSYLAWSKPWGHVLSLKSFCRNPALSWAIRYSVFQPVKFASSFEFVCGTLFSIFWHLMVKFGYNKLF